MERVVDVLPVPGLGPDPEPGRVRDPDLRPRVRLPRLVRVDHAQRQMQENITADIINSTTLNETPAIVL